MLHVYQQSPAFLPALLDGDSNSNTTEWNRLPRFGHIYSIYRAFNCIVLKSLKSYVESVGVVFLKFNGK